MKRTIFVAIAVAVCTVSFFALSSFTSINHTRSIVSPSLEKHPHGYVQVIFNRVGPHTFFINGAVNDFGMWTMQVTRTGSTFHCVNTLAGKKGTIVATSDCSDITQAGVWHIVGGTRAYHDISGNGTLMMYPWGEFWKGTLNNGKDDSDDDDSDDD